MGDKSLGLVVGNKIRVISDIRLIRVIKKSTISNQKS